MYSRHVSTPQALLRVAQGWRCEASYPGLRSFKKTGYPKGVSADRAQLATTLSAGNLEMVLLQEGGKPSGTRP